MVVNKTKKPIGASSIYKLNLKKKKKNQIVIDETLTFYF